MDGRTGSRIFISKTVSASLRPLIQQYVLIGNGQVESDLSLAATHVIAATFDDIEEVGYSPQSQGKENECFFDRNFCGNRAWMSSATKTPTCPC